MDCFGARKSTTILSKRDDDDKKRESKDGECSRESQLTNYKRENRGTFKYMVLDFLRGHTVDSDVVESNAVEKPLPKAAVLIAPEADGKKKHNSFLRQFSSRIESLFRRNKRENDEKTSSSGGSSQPSTSCSPLNKRKKVETKKTSNEQHRKWVTSEVEPKNIFDRPAARENSKENRLSNVSEEPSVQTPAVKWTNDDLIKRSITGADKKKASPKLFNSDSDSDDSRSKRVEKRLPPVAQKETNEPGKEREKQNVDGAYTNDDDSFSDEDDDDDDSQPAPPAPPPTQTSSKSTQEAPPQAAPSTTQEAEIARNNIADKQRRVDLLQTATGAAPVNRLTEQDNNDESRQFKYFPRNND